MKYGRTAHTSLILALVLAVALVPTAAPAQSITQVNGVIAIGDSLTAGTDANNGVFFCTANGLVLTALEQDFCQGNGDVNVGGWVPEVAQLLGTDVYNFGNSGEIASEINARLSAAMASQPSSHVFIMAGTNDALFTPSGISNPTNALVAINAMVQQVLDADRIPVVATVPPLFGGIGAASEPAILEINALIEALPDQYPGLAIADVYNQLAPNWAQNTSGDFVHLGALGNTVVANAWSSALTPDTDNLIDNGVLPAILDLLLDKEGPITP